MRGARDARVIVANRLLAAPAQFVVGQREVGRNDAEEIAFDLLLILRVGDEPAQNAARLRAERATHVRRVAPYASALRPLRNRGSNLRADGGEDVQIESATDGYVSRRSEASVCAASAMRSSETAA